MLDDSTSGRYLASGRVVVAIVNVTRRMKE
jgi:hypothetical protein